MNSPVDGEAGNQGVAGPLAGRRVAVPETRELETMSRMLERQGASVLRCPLVAIIDAADPAPVEAWLRRFIATPPHDLILLTGEGLGRLLGVAERAGIEGEFRAALAGVRRICRGPKPSQKLRSIGLGPDLAPEPATTAGIIAGMEALDLRGRRVAVVVSAITASPVRGVLRRSSCLDPTADPTPT